MQYLGIVFLLLHSSSLFSNYAALDTSFNGSGFTFTTSSWTSQQQTCTAIQEDGKILVAGNAIAAPSTTSQVAIVRFNNNGTLDTSFNASGSTPGTLIYTIPGNYNLQPPANSSINLTYGIAVQSDQKIILTGTANIGGGWPYIFILKCNADGTLDTTFGTGIGITPNTGTNVATSNTTVFGYPGSILYSWSNTVSPYAILPQVDNKIVLAGQSGNTSPICLRFLSNGALDTTANNGSGFGATPASSALGYFTVPVPSNGVTTYPYLGIIKSLSIDQTTQNIYMAGQSNPTTSSAASNAHYPVIYQCSPAGILNNYGIVMPNTSPVTYGAVISTNTTFIQGAFNNVIMQPDHKAVAIGTATFNNGTSYCMIIARFTATGVLDTTFGNGLGYVANTLSSTGQGICLNENGQIIVTGAYGTTPYTAIYRFNADGTLDTTFTQTGYFAFNSIGYNNSSLGNGITDNGKIQIGAIINNQFGAFQMLGSNELQSTTPSVLTYGFNPNYFTDFLYVNTYAQIISDTTARNATVSAINSMLTNYAQSYNLQNDFNYLLYLYLLESEIAQIQTNLIATYPTSSDEIIQFFL